MHINRNIMKLISFLLLFGYFVGCLANFNVDTARVSVQINGNELNVTVDTDMSKVVSVFFSAELSNECSTGYTFGLTSLTGKLLLSKTLKTNDKLRIFGVFQTNSSVHTKSYEYIISENGKGILQPENKISAGETTCANRHQSEPQDDKGDIVFEEYFDDRTRWENYVFIGRSGKQEDHAIFVKNTTALKNGNMLITAHLTQFVFILNLTDCTHEKGLCFQKYRAPQMPPPIHSGAVFTKQLFEHGHFEVRAKFPKGDFLRPYIMLQQAEKKFGADFAKQIHIAYANGNEQLMDRTHNEMGGSTVAGSVVISPSWKGDFIEHKRFKRHKENKHYGDEFHNYTMIWKPDSITYKVDGEFFGAIKDKKVLDELQNQKFNLVLGLTARGKLNFNFQNLKLDRSTIKKVGTTPTLFSTWVKNNAHSNWKQPQLEVESIRVHKLKQ